ncbi:MAG TPA: single-stranded DNA-binding protein [Candidatus Binatia bacterium]|nr:single-stranded DNA-binding protein [Candidatus Binatia bacterium]
MARSVNQVILMGNLTRDPEVRQTPNGQSVCSFSLALNRSYKGQNDEWQEATDYIDIVAWAALGERVGQYLSKGRRCLVQGRLQSRSWEQEGQKRSKVEVVASDVTFLDGRPTVAGSDDATVGAATASNTTDNTDAATSTPKPAKPAKDVVIEDIGDEPINLDDIPF